MSSFNLIAAAQEYLSWDPNVETKSALQTLLDSDNQEELTKLLCKRMAFGTAGLRGPMGVGYCRMNELVIVQTTQGLIKYLQSLLGAEEVASQGIVLGYDHRRFGTITSGGLARIAAAVALHEGVKVYMLENEVATPFVPFAITHYNCCAGVMVTASHNPKRDNGFKVYFGNGSQIIPPHDSGISAAIDKNMKPWDEKNYAGKYETSENLYAADEKGLARNCTVEVTNAYYEAMLHLCKRRSTNANSTARIAYTAMHGVGYQWIKRAFEVANHIPVLPVTSQQISDPEFPTVAFPNPEEKGALDQAILFANANNCSVIIANDPDADRLCVAEKRQDGTYEDTHPNNGWKIFTGNEIGTMLGHRQMMQYKADRKNGAGSGKEAGVLASVVSSRMLKQMAKAEGIHYFDTLTGFKWLGNKSIELQAKDMEILFSYEEALGFCVGTVVNDKDGISAATIFVELVCELNEKSPGSNTVVQDHLQSLYDTYGEFAAYNSYVISHDGQVTDAIFHRLRNSGGVNNDGTGYWTECAGSKIVSIQDITKGYSFSASADSDSKQDKLPCTPDSHMIMFEFENGVSVTLRTSGTEPKIKFYTEIAGSVGEKREIIEKKLHAFVEKLVEEMLQPTLHKLGRP